MIKSIFITGANGGVGSALCQKYSSEGYYVIASDLADEPTHQFCNAYVDVDLNEFVLNDAYQAETLNRLKEYTPELLINNAATQIIGSFADYQLENWQKTFNVNLSSAFLLIKAFAKSLEDQNGQIINIASIHGKLTKPGFFAYATSKAALIGLTKSLAVEFKGKITVNAVSPAAIETDMLKAGFDNNQDKIDDLAKIHPSQQLGSANQLANFVFQITQMNNRFVNGSNFEIDGGIGGALLDLEH
jgi:NAD(P)-dependent dehydrogenase (short-subunit alcohol dehydrogenase family)